MHMATRGAIETFSAALGAGVIASVFCAATALLLARTIAHADEIKNDLAGSGYTLPQAALKWVLAHPAVSTVIPGIRNLAQAEANCGVSDLPAMPATLVEKLRRHNWRRGVWYGGK